jgi:hypothetical protein
MERKERYKTDAEYRERVNKDNRDRYHRKMKDPEFAKLAAARARISNARVAIEHHEARASFFYRRIRNDLKLIAKLRDIDD